MQCNRCDKCGKIFKRKNNFEIHTKKNTCCINKNFLENEKIQKNEISQLEENINNMYLENSDVIDFIKTLPQNSIQCIICDPPFGLDEKNFHKHYARNPENIVEGYQEAPKNSKSYEEWSKLWIQEIPRVLKPDGTFYIVCSWNHLCDVELAIRSVCPKLIILNHIIWKYNFGVYTQKKFVTSHYHILRCGIENNTPTFYNCAFFNETEKTLDGGSAQYTDMEDVWIIPKEYSRNEIKNINKLPDELVRKIILYSTAIGDTVADFFLGNFTTAYVARKEGRKIIGCEINTNIFNYHLNILKNMIFTEESITQRKTSMKPKKFGKKITEVELSEIIAKYDELHKTMTKTKSVEILTEEFQRGKFSILNILKKYNR